MNTSSASANTRNFTFDGDEDSSIAIPIASIVRVKPSRKEALA